MKNVEKHYNNIFKKLDEVGEKSYLMGNGIAWAFHDDPRHVLFTLSRYKFVAKMFNGLSNVLEVGCGDGFASRLVLQQVKKLTAIDVDLNFINNAKNRNIKDWHITFKLHDMLDGGPILEEFDAAFSLDVIEHIKRNNHELFLNNICKSLSSSGILIVGHPSIESQPHASPQSKLGHISCMTQSELKQTLEKHFKNVFIFSMNDEVIHTGFSKMSHYNLALCTGKY